MQLFCDFDGTISRQDTVDTVLSRHAPPDWEAIEEEWKQGQIGSAECMQRQIALLNGDLDTLNATLDGIEIDASFEAFVDFCHQSAIDITIVSDGVDYFIQRILGRVGLSHLPVIANHLVKTETGFALATPYADRKCVSGAGVCKCRLVEGSTEPRIYVGDGRSDFCVSEEPEIVFAKSSLASYCAMHAIPFISYEDFSDVAMALGRLLPVANYHPLQLS